jgi:hypothetical protein
MEGKVMAKEIIFNLGNNSRIITKDTSDWEESNICVNIEITDISDDFMPVILKAVEDEKKNSVKYDEDLRKLMEDRKISSKSEPLIWGKTEIDLMNLVVIKNEGEAIRTYIDVFFNDDKGHEATAQIPINLSEHETDLKEIILDDIKNSCRCSNVNGKGILWA